MVKTKFDTLVKIKKLEVDKVSREITKQNGKISKAKTELNLLQNELNEMKYPQSGNFSLITQLKLLQKALLTQIDSKKEAIEFLEKQKKLLQTQLKEKELDYEKMKYLQGEEIKKILKKMKKEEDKQMDEIALMLFKGKEQ